MMCRLKYTKMLCKIYCDSFAKSCLWNRVYVKYPTDTCIHPSPPFYIRLFVLKVPVKRQLLQVFHQRYVIAVFINHVAQVHWWSSEIQFENECNFYTCLPLYDGHMYRIHFTVLYITFLNVAVKWLRLLSRQVNPYILVVPFHHIYF